MCIRDRYYDMYLGLLCVHYGLYKTDTVSYTHLDVYKRQGKTYVCILVRKATPSQTRYAAEQYFSRYTIRQYR